MGCGTVSCRHGLLHEQNGQVARVDKPNHPALESLLLAQMRLSTLTIADLFLGKKTLKLLEHVLQQHHARDNPPLQVESMLSSYVGGNGKQNTKADERLVLCSRIPALSHVDSDTSSSFMLGHHRRHALTCSTACIHVLLQGLSVAGWYESELSCDRVQELLLSAPLARLQHLSIGMDAEQVHATLEPKSCL